MFSHLRSAVAERFLMMQLFEEGPFHLLVIPSGTGQDFIEANRQLTLGGFEEGEQTSLLIDQLMNSKEPLHSLLETIHLVGISLGAHGQWFAKILDQGKTNPRVDRLVQFCPMVHLQASLATEKNSWLLKQFFDLWMEQRLSPLKDSLGLTPEMSIKNFLEHYFKSYTPPSWVQNKEELLTSTQRPSLKSFWEWNDFWKWSAPSPLKNTFVIWNQMDPIVDPINNVQTLLTRSEFAEVLPLRLPRGFHCSLSSSYQWQPLSLTLRAYLDRQFHHQKTILWQKIFPDLQGVRELKALSVDVDLKQGLLNLSLGIKSGLVLISSQTLSLPLPLAASDFPLGSELKNDWSIPLQASVLRELGSRLQWKQTDHGLKIWIHSRSYEN